MLRFLTAGESHGPTLVVIIDGVPAGLELDLDAITRDLRRRQGGYGRGRRMSIETDTAVAVAGVRHGRTTGAPVAITIENRDWANWEHTMHAAAMVPDAARGARRGPVTRPRPGHADLAGALKFGHHDMRNVLERASARETAARVAAGAVARQILQTIGVRVSSHVIALGDVAIDSVTPVPFAMIAAIDAARAAGDTLGGSYEVVAVGVPPGLGSYTQWDVRLDGRLAQALMSIPAIKAVGVGLGADAARLPGSRVHDEILPREHGGPDAPPWPVERPTNHAGGIEGGMSNGEELRLTAAMKPIATLMKPLRSVDLATGHLSSAAIERSDVCAVPAAAVIGEAMVAFVLAQACLERFGGDTIEDLRRNHAGWCDRTRQRLAATGGTERA